MTIDERLEFLVQSTESLHETVMEHSRQIMLLSDASVRLIQLAERNEQRWMRVMKVMRDALDAGLNGEGEEG